MDEVASPVRAALETHPKFKLAKNLFFGSKQLMREPFCQAHTLLKLAVDRDPISAVTWLHKVHSVERADVRYVAEVYGLKVAKMVRLKNGVCLCPLSGLPPSGLAKAIQSQFLITPNRLPVGIRSIPVGAMLEIQGVPGRVSYAEAQNDYIAPPRSDELARTIRGFSLLDGAAPVVGVSWLEFVDDDLPRADFGGTCMRAT